MVTDKLVNYFIEIIKRKLYKKFIVSSVLSVTTIDRFQFLVMDDDS